MSRSDIPVCDADTTVNASELRRMLKRFSEGVANKQADRRAKIMAGSPAPARRLPQFRFS
jgi:hypothetical protein